MSRVTDPLEGGHYYVPVEPDTIAIMAFTGFVASVWGALIRARLNRIEDKISSLTAQWIDEGSRRNSRGS